MTTMTTPPPLFEPFPSYSYPYGHMIALVELNDVSFVSCNTGNAARRWLRTTTPTNNHILQLLGAYQGHEHTVWCVMEKDDNTLLTASFDKTVKVWNKTTYECLDTLEMGSAVFYMLKTKDNTRFVCGLGGGTVEMRRVSDHGVLFSFNVHGRTVTSVCELEDGSFVSSAGKTMDRWDENGKMLQTFSGHSETIKKVIELNRDVIVSASHDTTVKMWKVSTGECLCTLTLHSTSLWGVEKVNDGVFVSVSYDGKIVVWDDKGECIETHQSGGQLTMMTTLRDGSILTGNSSQVEIRQLTSSLSLTHKCAKVIGKNIRKEVLEGLAMAIPEELYQMCVMYHDCKW